MKIIDNSYFGSFYEVMRFVERVEAMFIDHFANANRSKRMNILRSKAKRERNIELHSPHVEFILLFLILFSLDLYL